MFSSDSDSLSLILLLVENMIVTRENLNHARNTPSAFCKRYTKISRCLRNFPFCPFCFDDDLEIMISPFISAGFKGRPECGTALVSLNYLCCRLDHIYKFYSTKHSEFLFSNKNTQHSHKGRRLAIFVYCIRYFFLRGLQSEAGL